MKPEKAKAALDELAALFPAPRSFEIADRTVAIERCTIAQGGRILDVGIPIWVRLSAHGDVDPLVIFDAYPADALNLLVAATGFDREWLTTLDAIDRLALASAWMEINAGFFVRRLLLPLLRMRAAIYAVNSGAGPMSSPTSKEPAVPIPATSRPKRQPSKSPQSTENNAVSALND